MKNWLKVALFCFGSLALVSWDRATKDLAKEHLMNKAPVSYWHDTFRLEYAENTGAAMSLGDGLPAKTSFWLLGILPLVLLSALFVYTIHRSKDISLPKMLSLSLIIAGGLGNIIDRLLFDRHVTDFINIGINELRTGIFNFADVFITAGAICLLVFYKNKKASAGLAESA
jgi:signal peptidase II